MGKEKVCIVGSGNWGSAIARITGINTKKHSDIFEEEVTMYVHEEEASPCHGQPLSALINEKHENVKYLPGVQLGSNVRAEPDLAKALKDATALVVVVPHQFFDATLKQMRGHVSERARAVSLIKGLKAEGSKIITFPAALSSALNIRCSALGGANIAKEVGQDMFCESTLGVPSNSSSKEGLSDSELWFKLFQTPTFRIRTVEDVEGVCLCGGLKNIVALAAGFSDGLGWGSNTKAAIIRIGLMEIKDFCLEFFPSTQPDTFLQESCGVADIVTSSISGRNRMVAEEMAKSGKSFQELEKEKLNGQQLEGPQTAEQLYNFITAHGNKDQKGKFRLLENVWKICFQGMPPDKLLEGL